MKIHIILFCILELLFTVSNAQNLKLITEGYFYGVQNTDTKKVILKPIFYDIQINDNSLVATDNNYKVTLYDTDGNNLITTKYDKLSVCNNFNELVIITEHNKYSIYNFVTKKYILKDFKTNDNGYCFNFDGLSYIDENGRIPAIVKGKVGLIDIKGKEYLPFKYDKIIVSSYFSEAPIYLLRKGKKNFEYLNGKFISIKGKDIYGFFKGLAVVQNKRNSLIFFDDNGNLVTPSSKLFSEEDDLFKLDFNGKFALFSSKKLSKLTAFKYDEITIQIDTKKPQSSYITAIINEKMCLITANGKELTPFIYSDILKTSDETEAIYIVQKGEKYGIINSEGEVIIEPIYDDISTNKGYKTIQLKNKCGFINNQGKIIIPIKYDNAFNFSLGLAAVETSGKWGFINNSGIMIIPAIYEKVSIFIKQNDTVIANVKKNGKFGFINTKNEVVIPIIYDKSIFFWNGKGKATLNGKTFYIDTAGNKL